MSSRNEHPLSIQFGQFVHCIFCLLKRLLFAHLLNACFERISFACKIESAMWVGQSLPISPLPHPFKGLIKNSCPFFIYLFMSD